MQTKGEEALDRSVAQFFFEVGYAACWADAFIQNDQKPPFHLTDAIIERAWQTSYESYEEPAVFDAKLAMANAAPEMLEADEEALDTLEKLRADLAEENADLHAQRIAVIDLTIAQLRAAIARAKGLPS